MKVWANAGHFILEVPRERKEEIAKLMAYRGLTFSTSASSSQKAILWTNSPYGLADLAEDCPELAPYRDAIDASRALDGIGTMKLPPGRELWGYQKATLDYLLARKGGINGDQHPGIKLAILRVAAREFMYNHSNATTLVNTEGRKPEDPPPVPKGWREEELAQFDRMRRRTAV